MGPRSGIDHRRIFDASTSPTLVLDAEFVVVTANRAHLAVTDRHLEDLVDGSLFEVFPDDPDADDTVGEPGLCSSFRRGAGVGRDPPDGGPPLRPRSARRPPVISEGSAAALVERAQRAGSSVGAGGGTVGGGSSSARV